MSDGRYENKENSNFAVTVGTNQKTTNWQIQSGIYACCYVEHNLLSCFSDNVLQPLHFQFCEKQLALFVKNQ